MRDIRLLLCINIKISARNFFCSFLLVYPEMKFLLKKYVYKTSIIDRGFSRTRRVCRNVFVWLLRWSVNRSWKILHKLHHLSFVRSCNNEWLGNSRLSPTAPIASINMHTRATSQQFFRLFCCWCRCCVRYQNARSDGRLCVRAQYKKRKNCSLASLSSSARLCCLIRLE